MSKQNKLVRLAQLPGEFAELKAEWVKISTELGFPATDEDFMKAMSPPEPTSSSSSEEWSGSTDWEESSC